MRQTGNRHLGLITERERERERGERERERERERESIFVHISNKVLFAVKCHEWMPSAFLSFQRYFDG